MRSPIAVLAVFALLAFAGGATAASPAPQPAPIKVTVVAKEFSFSFTKTSVRHGSTVVCTVVNHGQLAHNLVFTTLGKAATPLLSPGKKATLTVKFPKKGHFYYICSVPNHAEEGMAGAFVVT
jgi:uncharacterized cupredoxin-like copper-binding protein